MRQKIKVLQLFGFIAFCLVLGLIFPDRAEAKCTVQTTMDGTIGPASLDFLQRSLRKAKAENCSSVLVLINTPGGSLQSTRLIVEEILNSQVPILCLVYPSGAHAGSAGAILMQACHVNGGVKATNIGAATPIAGSGQELPEDLRKKLINDTRSWVEGLTKLRGRNEKFGREIIIEAKAVDADEAFKLGAIDYVAKDKEDFLKFAESREVRMANEITVHVEVGEIHVMEKDLRHRLVDLLTDPQIAYLILMGSLGLLYFEITHPGMIAPGVIGGVGLVIALISLHKLDVMWGGLALILLGLVFMIAEVFVPSFGILGLGGVVSFVVGSIFLFEPGSGYQLPLGLVLPTAVALGLLTFAIAIMAIRTRKVKKRGGYDELMGLTGEVVQVNSENSNRGLIELNGETWKFIADSAVQRGDRVKVFGHQGLTLKVSSSKKESL